MINKIIRFILICANPVLFPITRFLARIFIVKRNDVRVLIRCGGETLLVMHPYGPRQWVPPGGGVKRRESSEDAARREVREEVGIALQELRSCGSFPIGAKAKTFVFTARVPTKTFHSDTIEISEVRWFADADLPLAESRFLRRCFEAN